jgi:hypothetical protein
MSENMWVWAYRWHRAKSWLKALVYGCKTPRWHPAMCTCHWKETGFEREHQEAE